MSLELRWFFQGGVPDEINRWFNKEFLNNADSSLEKQESYQDIYLFNPEVNNLNIKFRNENFVIKWRSNTDSINMKIKNKNIIGNIEDWILWNFKVSKDSEDSEEMRQFLGKNNLQPWLKINKKRQRINYIISNNPNEFLVSQNILKANCSIELSTVILDKNKDISWWTIAVELFKKNNNNYKNNEDEKLKVEKISKTFLKNYPHNNLLGIRSYGYPQLFSLYANLIKS